MDTASFLQTHRVFSLEEAVRALDPKGGRKAALERLKYAVARGKVKKLMRGVYASIPPGTDPEAFQPDPFLAAVALRPEAVFSHHSALELLGVAHSEWRQYSAYSSRRPQRFSLNGLEVQFVSYPSTLIQQDLARLGTREIRRFDRKLTVTGPERTLVDGFRQPDRVGGLAELVESAAGFPVLEIPLLLKLLHAYRQKVLWAAVGWFLDTYRETFFVSEADLATIEKQVPRAPQYLAKDSRGGVLVQPWNLIVPTYLAEGREPDESGF